MESSLKKIIFVLAILLLPNLVDAQRWKQYRRQLTGGFGVTNFLGDLGGGNDIGRDGLADLNILATRPAIFVGYRYQLNSFLFLRSNLTWGLLKGDDAFTEEVSRKGRNLSFSSMFVELNGMVEFYIVQNAKGNRYRLRGVRGKRGLNMDVYIFGGLGYMYFNPTAIQNGQSVSLQPIGTEGQGLPDGGEKYSRFTLTIPYGIGIGKYIDRYWSVNLELAMRMTFTDYIDDVSGLYYGWDKIYDNKIAAGYSVAEAKQAQELSDRNIYQTVAPGRLPEGTDLKGEKRGDSNDNDAFVTGMLTVSRKIVRRRRSRPKF